jgi:hypothetical protein
MFDRERTFWTWLYARGEGQDIWFCWGRQSDKVHCAEPVFIGGQQQATSRLATVLMEISELHVTSTTAPVHSKSDSSTKTAQIIVNSHTFMKNEA